MAIASLLKVNLIGPLERREEILVALQELGGLHIIESSEGIISDQPEISEKAADALQYLAASARKRKQKHKLDQPLEELVEQVLQNKHQRADKIDEIELIRQHIQALKPWGNFRFAPLEEMDGYRLWFYQVPLFRLDALSSCPYPWQEIARDHRQHYVVLIARDEPGAEAVPFVRMHTGDRSCAELHEQLERAEGELEELNAQREALTAWHNQIQQWLNFFRDTEDRSSAAQQCYLDHDVQCFVLQAWVPEKLLPELDRVVSTGRLAVTLSPPDDHEEPPILLDNPPALAGAEAVVGFFQLPGYRSWDPTPVVFFSFAFFFAMILSDAGYASLLGIYLGFRWKHFSRTKTGQTLRGLLIAILVSSVVYGILVGSYFGVSPEPDTLLGRLQCLDMKDFDAMMMLSLIMGVSHLLIANGIKSFMLPEGFRRWAPWGWNLLIGGGFLYWVAMVRPGLGAWFHGPGLLGMVLGTLVVLFCSGSRVIHQWSDAAFRLTDGLKALYGISKAFGDVLSYLRLFALGLASASLALTFNQLAVDARDSVEHGGFILFTLVLVAGHGLNLVLGVMSGVIHGLRLNLLEFYNWGVEGEGTPFKPFRKRGE